MSGKIHIIHFDGSIAIQCYEGEEPTLEKLQKEVGGYIELIHVMYEGSLHQAFVNEDGRRLKLPINLTASHTARQPIVGSMVILKPECEDEEPKVPGCHGFDPFDESLPSMLRRQAD